MSATSTQPNANPARNVLLYKPTHKDTKRPKSNRIYHVSDDAVSLAESQAGKGIKLIQFKDGHLFVDHIHIVRPLYKNNLVTWRQLTDSHYTCGHLNFSHGDLSVHGSISLGNTEADAQRHLVIGSLMPFINPHGATSAQSMFLAHTPGQTHYTTQITKQRYPVTQDPNSLPEEAWETGLTLSLGFDPAMNRHGAVLGDLMDIHVDLAIRGTLNPNEIKLGINSHVHNQFNAGDGKAPYVDASILLKTDDLSHFAGYVAGVYGETGSKPDGVYLWKGSLAKPKLTATATATATAAPALISKTALLQTTALSLDDLVTQTPGEAAEASDINGRATGILIENMKWALAQDSTTKEWLKLFYGDSVPGISQERQNLVNQSLSWYQNNYGKAQLCWQAANFSGQNKPPTQLTYYQMLQLQYYLQTGLAKEPDFVRQQQGIYPFAYAQAVPGINAYLADGGEKWAQDLFDNYLMGRLCIDQGLVAQTGDMHIVNQYATLLTVLQPSGDLARQYYSNFLSTTLQAQADTVLLNDPVALMQWLPTWLETFLNQISTNPNATQDLKLIQSEVNDYLAATGKKAVDLAQDMTDILVSAPGSTIWQACSSASDAWVNKFSKTARVGRLFFIAGFSFGITQVVSAYRNWNNLSDEDRTKLVTSTVDYSFEAIQIVPEFLMELKDGWNNLVSLVNKLRGTKEAIDSFVHIGETLDENFVEVGLEETTKLFNAETKVIEAEGSMWAKVFGGPVKIVLKVVGVVAAAVIAALSIYDLWKAITSNQPVTTIVLDALIAAANLAVLVCVVVEAVVASTVASVFGVIFAIIGVILTIIAMCVIKPTDSFDDFMKNVALPFVNSLPPQKSPYVTSTSTGDATSPTLLAIT